MEYPLELRQPIHHEYVPLCTCQSVISWKRETFRIILRCHISAKYAVFRALTRYYKGMYITDVKVDNYKSFGKDDNKLRVDERKTAIIGVNESGKSNLLGLIGKIDFNRILSQDYYSGSKNLNYLNDEQEIKLTLKFNDDERIKFDVKTDHGTVAYFTIGKFATFSGELSAVIKKDQIITDALNTFEEAIKKDDVETSGSYLSKYKESLSNLKKIDNSIIVINSLNDLANSIRASSNVDFYKDKLAAVKERLLMYYSLFPIIVYRTTKDMTELKSFYSDKDAEQALKDEKNPLYLLTDAASVKIKDMQSAFSMPDNNARSSLRYKIENKIEKNVCEKFRNFYDQTDYELNIKFESNKLCIRVITGDNRISISERSNGFRWFFGLFLQVASQDYVNRNIVYVLDEPGVFLHINAQKELLSLFDELTENKGQVIYSTHLPTMIDVDNLQSIRRIEKDEQGNSHIFNTFYGNGINKTSKEDTLAPLLQAMGCNYGDVNITDQRLNIVTEGPTDKYYLEAGMSILRIPKESRPHIIAAQGASNISNIMAILLGWGCDCVALFDYDKAGIKEYRSMVKSYGDGIGEHLRFVIDSDTSSKEYENNPKTIESIISKDMNSQLPTPYNGKNDTKTIAALGFKDMICQNKVAADQETVNNYRELFKRLGIVPENDED